MTRGTTGGIPGGLRAALLAGLALLAVAGCKGRADEDAKKEDSAIPVETAPVEVGPIDAAYRGTATLEAEGEAMVVAKQGGVIEQVLVEEGDRVRAGQVLARLESDRLRLAAVQSQASLDKLKSDFNRIESVYQRNLVSKEAYEQKKYELEGAQASHDLAALALREAEIKSPIDGVVTQRAIKAGNMIQPQSPAFQVTKMDRLEAHVFVPERDIHKLAADQPAELVVDAWPERTFKGAIERVNPVVDAKTGTVKVTVLMAPGQPELRPGMFGRVEVRYDRREKALLVPKDAVITEDAMESVFVVTGGKAQRRTVKLGYSDPWRAEVLEGLSAGEQVVVTGQNSLKDDAKVDIVNAAPPPATPLQASKAQPAG